MSMMYQPLLVSSIIEQAAVNYPDQRIVSRNHRDVITEISYQQLLQRCKQLANVLTEMDISDDDKVATLAWNSHYHLEAYYAVSGMGAVIHTVNPRLFDDQISYIINHAVDKVLLLDPFFVPLLERIHASLPALKAIIVFCEEADMPDSDLPLLCYESLINEQKTAFQWPVFEETKVSCLCYTSGTTGSPKGVCYTHRSTVLHALASCMPNALNLSTDTVVMPVVPMYHVCAWGLPYSALISGCKLVLPGSGMDGESLLQMIHHAGADLLLGVPTVWLTLLAHLESTKQKMPTVKTIAVGGSAAPKTLVEQLDQQHGIYLMPLWGMTETSPLATFGVNTQQIQSEDAERRYQHQTTAGKNIWGIELALFDDDLQPVDRGAKQSANLMVRGHWVADSYFKNEKPESFNQHWFDTGDIAKIDDNGYLQIVDRKKDVIKSGGEWISSIDLENAAVAHPAVAEACVVGIPHPKWDERPLLFVVAHDQSAIDTEDIMRLLEQRVAKWWLPDDIMIVNELPHTATGKLQKNVLRDQYHNYFS